MNTAVTMLAHTAGGKVKDAQRAAVAVEFATQASGILREYMFQQVGQLRGDRGDRCGPGWPVAGDSAFTSPSAAAKRHNNMPC